VPEENKKDRLQRSLRPKTGTTGSRPQKLKLESGVEEQAEGPTQTRTYTVQAGDTLGKIAKKFYGDAGNWKTIFEANKDKIANPDAIQIGQELVIP
jgi:nucleoid-associated protein YgaU